MFLWYVHEDAAQKLEKLVAAKTREEFRATFKLEVVKSALDKLKLLLVYPAPLPIWWDTEPEALHHNPDPDLDADPYIDPRLKAEPRPTMTQHATQSGCKIAPGLPCQLVRMA